jgi:Txe/YoeB family toxin of Txe-Axe toxin-antitoxin module
MTWIQLFKSNSIDAALQKRRKNYFHVDPILKGQHLKFVKNLFTMTKLPFVWDDKEIIKENNPISPYHKLPKSIIKTEKARFERILKLRQGIASAKEKELKYRQESLNKRTFRGINEVIKKTMPFMIKQTQIKLEGESRGGKSRKLVAEHVRDVPRLKNVDFGRRHQEKVKNLFEDNIMSANSITDNLKQNQKNKQEIKQKEVEKKKADTKLDKRVLSSNSEPSADKNINKPNDSTKKPDLKSKIEKPQGNSVQKSKNNAGSDSGSDE